MCLIYGNDSKKANGIFKLMLWLAALILIKMYVNSFKLHSLLSFSSSKKLDIFLSEWVDGYDDAVERMMNCLLKHELWWWVEWLMVDMRISGTLSTYVSIYIDVAWTI